jgi:hypothetical protein
MDAVFLPVLIAIFIVAPIGAIDALYFHSIKYKLYANPDSRMEQVTHILRAFMLGIAVLLLVVFEPNGAWFWGVGAIFVLDFLNNVIDVSLEHASRQKLGGLTRAEYVIHIVGASGMGGVTFAYFILGWRLGDLPTALAPVEHHTLVMVAGYAVVAGAFLGAISETALTLKHSGQSADQANG